MDTADCQGCCNGDLQNGDNTVHGARDEIKPQPFCLQDSQVPNKSPITPETLVNVPGGCHGNCCILTVFNNPDMSTREKDPYKDVEAPDNVQNTHHLSLATLPPELILVIFSYLDARFSLRVLTCVCRLFHDLLSSESCWKTRFGKRWPQRDRREDYDYISSWKRICVQHEDMDKFWNDPDSTLDFYELKDQHFATVDAVHIMKGGDMCISGSRDRTVGVWSLNALTDPAEAGYSKRSFKQALDGHKGWVWCLSSDPTGAPRVCSGSWDSRIKLWDLEGQNTEMTTLSAHKAAVLCMAWEQEMLISGSYDKTVSLWDLRGGNSVGRLKNHTKPVLCLSVDDRFIISGSEDQTLSVYDRRAAKVYKTIKLGSPVFSMCRSSTCDYNYLRAGGREGRLYLLDTTFDKFEEITPSIDLESKGKISGMCHYGGAVVACSTDKSIKVLEPSRVLSVIHSFDCHSGEVASVSSRGSVLASCYSELSIGIWRPKSMRPGSA